jgi:hypothetical protein
MGYNQTTNPLIATTGDEKGIWKNPMRLASLLFAHPEAGAMAPWHFIMALWKTSWRHNDDATAIFAAI